MVKQRTTAGKVALPVILVTTLCIVIAFSTTHWLENWDKYYGDKFDKLGLWVHCFRSLPDPNDVNHLRYFTGCRWVYNPFTYGYAEIRNFLQPPFFIAVQFFFTICFVMTMIGFIGASMYVLCFHSQNQVRILKAVAIDLLVAGISGMLAVIIFGALGDSENWMPNPEHNYLSWSFGLAVVGSFGLFVSAVLFLVEAKVQKRKHSVAQSQSTFVMEQKV